MRQPAAATPPPKLDGSAGVYLFTGEEMFLRRLYLRRLIELAVGRGEEAAMAVSDFDGNDVALAAVMDELRTLPFLVSRRVVVVQNADAFITRQREALERYANEPCPTGVLVLLSDRSQANTNLFKRIAARGGVVRCDKLTQADLVGWVRQRARDPHERSIDSQTAAMLVDLVGDDLDRLDSELAKLAAYVGAQRKTISVADVDELVANKRVHEAFELTSAIGAGDARKALVRWQDMLAKDRGVEFTAVGLLAWQLRQILRARMLRRQGLSRDDVFRKLRLPYHVRDQFVEQVNRFSEKKLRRLIHELVRLDVSAKTGGMTAARGIEMFILTACES